MDAAVANKINIKHLISGNNIIYEVFYCINQNKYFAIKVNYDKINKHNKRYKYTLN